MWDWLANLLQTAKIRELERDKERLQQKLAAEELYAKDVERQRNGFKQGFDARGEELLVKQETLRITNEELGQLRAELGNRKAYVEQLEGEAEEGRKAFHELAGRHDSLREDRDGLARELKEYENANMGLDTDLTYIKGQLAAKEQQLGELAAARGRERRNCDYWSSAYWELRRHEGLWRGLYDLKHQQLMDTVEDRRILLRACASFEEANANNQNTIVAYNRQIARLEETVKRKDARVAYLEEELRRSLKRDPKTGRIIGGNYRGPRK